MTEIVLPQYGTGNIPTYPTFADFPATASDGAPAIALDTDTLYFYDAGEAAWKLVGPMSSVVTGLAPVGTVPNANAATISGNTLNLQPASASFPGVVTTGFQSFAGGKTFEAAPIFNTMTANTVATIDGSNQLVSSSVTTTELGYVSGVTSSIQTQINSKQATGNYVTALTGDVTATGPGSVSATIQSNVVSNTKLAQMPTLTLKGNNTGGTANAADLTASQVKTLLAITAGNAAYTPASPSSWPVPPTTVQEALDYLISIINANNVYGGA